MVQLIDNSLPPACCLPTGGPCRTSNNAALPLSAASSITALSARNIVTVITPARIATVPNAATNKPINGCKRNRLSCCQSLTSSSPLPCHKSCGHSLVAIRSCSTTCSSAPPLKLYSSWPRIHVSSAALSAWLACCTPGPANSATTLTSTSSSLAAASLTPPVGARHGRTSCYMKNRSPSSFALSSAMA